MSIKPADNYWDNSPRRESRCSLLSSPLKLLTCALAIFAGLGGHMLSNQGTPSNFDLAIPITPHNLTRGNSLLENYCFKRPNPNPPKPESHPVNQTALDLWVNSHCGKKRRQVAEKIAQSIRHVSQQEFERQLIQTIGYFNDHFTSLPKEEQRYVLVAIDGKSNAWVSDLAFPHLSIKPEAILNYPCHKDFLSLNPEIRHLVLFDDAIYSGLQMLAIIGSMPDRQIHVIVPFMTETNLLPLQQRPFTIYPNQKIKTVIDEIGYENVRYLKDYPLYGQYTTTTYFDHKVGDSVSFFNPLLSGFLPQPLTEEESCADTPEAIIPAPISRFSPPYSLT